MTKRPSIREALGDRDQQSLIGAEAPPQTTPKRPSGRGTSLLTGSRKGQINVSAYFPPEVKASLRMVQAKRGGKIQDVLGEALNLIFAEYNVPETAPVRDLD